MTRFGAGVGAGLGVMLGGIGGMYLGDMFHGQMSRNDSATAVGAIGAVLGAVTGAMIGFGSEPKQIQPVVVSGALHGPGDWHPIGIFS